nr:hypothetical protein [Ruania albidiflava]
MAPAAIVPTIVDSTTAKAIHTTPQMVSASVARPAREVRFAAASNQGRSPR